MRQSTQKTGIGNLPNDRAPPPAGGVSQLCGTGRAPTWADGRCRNARRTATPAGIKHRRQLQPWLKHPVSHLQNPPDPPPIAHDGHHVRPAGRGQLLHRPRAPDAQAAGLSDVRSMPRRRAAQHPIPSLRWMRECPRLPSCASSSLTARSLPLQMTTQYCVSTSLAPHDVPRADAAPSRQNAKSPTGHHISRSASTPLARSPRRSSTRWARA